LKRFVVQNYKSLKYYVVVLLETFLGVEVASSFHVVVVASYLDFVVAPSFLVV
jgi:hypothetical protein